MSKFEVGQKVRSIGDAPDLNKGELYTIKDIVSAEGVFFLQEKSGYYYQFEFEAVEEPKDKTMCENQCSNKCGSTLTLENNNRIILSHDSLVKKADELLCCLDDKFQYELSEWVKTDEDSHVTHFMARGGTFEQAFGKQIVGLAKAKELAVELFILLDQLHGDSLKG